MVKKFMSGAWLTEYTPEDGGRLNRLCYNDYDLITTAPLQFKAPAGNYGLYEKRAVYGYDDCFPTCEISGYPGKEWQLPDHGELCWLKWNSAEAKNRLTFSAKSKMLPVHFKREMVFSPGLLTWNFEVFNEGKVKQPFLHIMHPLIKLDDITEIKMPPFHSVYNYTSGKETKIDTGEELQEYLLNQPKGSAVMLFIRKIREGRMSWKYKNGLVIRSVFPQKLFSSIGIWWNNSGYPREAGLQRNECAFEPVPGNTSKLSESIREKKCLQVQPNNCFQYTITWEVINEEPGHSKSAVNI